MFPKKPNKILLLVAHTDDETLGMGGTICKHINNGDQVYAISMTDGVSSRAIGKIEKLKPDKIHQIKLQNSLVLNGLEEKIFLITLWTLYL